MNDCIKISVIGRDGNKQDIEIPTDMGLNLMEGLKINELPVEGTCGGMAMCASCHVFVHSKDLISLERNEDEQAMLDDTEGVEDNSRLTCQIPISPELDGAIIELAPLSDSEDGQDDW